MGEIMSKFYKIFLIFSLAISFSACGIVSNAMNPFYEPPTAAALKGEINDHALAGGSKARDARKALDSLATYERTHTPSPNKPVMKPAVVRLMWVPDHLNRFGDLIPAHYYYLKVKSDDFNVTDAFEIEAQLQGPRGRASSSSIPFVYGD